MCGIAGYCSTVPSTGFQQQLTHSISLMKHRGPDATGWHFSSCAGLAVQRLSIVDRTGGNQPIFNEDKSIWTVLNGEVYNYRRIRNMLEAKGHRFSTESDTEVLVHLYEEKGEQLVEFIEGIYAFAIWDEKERKLFLARDVMGVKPLVFTIHKDQVVKRKKYGFNLPLGLWIKNEYYHTINEVLSERNLREGNLFNVKTVRTYIDEHRNGIRNHRQVIWVLFIFELWRKQFLNQ